MSERRYNIPTPTSPCRHDTKDPKSSMRPDSVNARSRKVETCSEHGNFVKGTSQNNGQCTLPEIPMAYSVLQQIMLTVALQKPETGGILLGPIGKGEVTQFYFDEKGSCTASTYTPDHIGLNHMMKTQWIPSGIDMQGFVHSHPGRLDRPSLGDLFYIRKLLMANKDMNLFFAPIVIPQEFRICPFVILREDMNSARQAQLRLF